MQLQALSSPPDLRTRNAKATRASRGLSWLLVVAICVSCSGAEGPIGKVTSAGDVAAGCDVTSGAAVVVPSVTCVATDSADGSYAAVFGYSNPNAHAVTIPFGPSNQLVFGAPASIVGTQTRPVSMFESGSHPDAFVVRYRDGQAPPSWQLNGWTPVQPIASTPACQVLTDSNGVQRVSLSSSGAVVGALGLDANSIGAAGILAPETPLHFLGVARPVGALEGALDVSNDGAAHYRVPLWVPDGRVGMQPALALTYDSNARGGILGAGWALEGVSQITVCGTSFSTSGASGYCLDDVALLHAGTDEYRPENAPFTRVRVSRPRRDFMETWSVELPSGRIETFGGDQAHIASETPSDPTSPHVRFALARVEDRFGNAIAYDYDAALNVSSIRYTLDQSGNASRLVSFRYDGGHLSEVDISAPNPSSRGVVRAYHLDYNPTSLAAPPVLSTITECDGSGICRRPTAFGYSTGGAVFDEVTNRDGSPWMIPIPQNPALDGMPPALVGDFDGDGLDDLFYTSELTLPYHLRLSQSWILPDSGTSMQGPPGGDAHVGSWYEPGPVIATSMSQSTLVRDAGGATYKAPFPSVVDLDHDGVQEILFPTIAATAAGHFVVHHQIYGLKGGHFQALGAPIDVSDNASPVIFADFDGDGVPGVMVPRSIDSNNLAYDVFEQGTLGLFGADFVASMRPYASNPTVALAKSSMLQILTGASGASTYVRKPDPASWIIDQLRLRYQSDEGNLADVFCDDGADNEYGEQDLGTSGALAFDLGETGGAQVVYPFGHPNFTPWAPTLSVTGGTTSFTKCSYLSAGDEGTPIAAEGWNIPQLPALRDGQGNIDPLTTKAVFALRQTLDANGDGLTDLLLPERVKLGDATTRLGYRLYLRHGPRLRLLTDITTGHGDVTHLEYSPTTWGPATGTSDCAFPLNCGVTGINTVRTVTYHASDAGSKRSYGYAFEQPLRDLRGRGFLGFRTEVVSDQQTGSSTETLFERTASAVQSGGVIQYPYAHIPTSVTTTTTLPGGVTREEQTDFTLDVIASSSAPASVTPIMRGKHQVVTEDVASASRGRRRIPLGNVLSDVQVAQTYDAYGNPVQSTTTYAKSGDVDTVTRTWRSDVQRWLLSEPDTVVGSSIAKARSSRDGFVPGAASPRVTRYDVDQSTGAVIGVTRQPDDKDPDTWLHVSYPRNGSGQITSVTSTDLAGTASHTDIGYDAVDGTYPSSITDAAGETTYVVVHSALGVTIATLSPTGVVSRPQYDTFGTLRREPAPTCTQGDCSSPSHNSTTISYGQSAATKGVFRVSAVSADGALASADIDALGRVVGRQTDRLVETLAYDPIHIWSVATTSSPMVGTQSGSVLTTSRTYDALGRLTRYTAPNGGSSSVTYVGNFATLQGPSGEHSQYEFDDRGRVRTTTEWVTGGPSASAHPIVTSSDYGPFAALARVLDGAGNVRSFTRDSLGRRLQLIDPDSGTSRTRFDAFGRTREATNGAGVVTDYQFDSAGRLLATRAPDGQTCYQYEVGGALSARTFVSPAGDSTSDRWKHDGLSRVTQRQQEVSGAGGGDTLTAEWAYDDLGRIRTATLPTLPGSALSLAYGYDAWGNVTSIDSADGLVKWSRASMDVANYYESERFGDVVNATVLRDPLTLRPSLIQYVGGTEVIASVQHKYDASARLTARTGSVAGKAWGEKFAYDELSRVVGWRDGLPRPPQWDHAYSYSDIGGVLTDTSQSFGSPVASSIMTAPSAPTPGTSPAHGVASVDGVKYEYDGAGRVTRIGATSVDWTSFGLPAAVTSPESVRAYRYDGGGVRVLETDSMTGTTVRHFGAYDRRSTGGGTEHVVTVAGPDHLVAEVHYLQSDQGSSSSVRYLLPDAMGSTMLVTSASGTVVGDPKVYDAFGTRVDAANPTRTYSGSDSLIANSFGSPASGFEEHRLSDASGLIDMGGRVFDTNSRRFLSPDPILGAAQASQSLNRLSFVGNVGFNATDPTGLCTNDTGSSGCGNSSSDSGGQGGYEADGGQSSVMDPVTNAIASVGNAVSDGAKWVGHGIAHEVSSCFGLCGGGSSGPPPAPSQAYATLQGGLQTNLPGAPSVDSGASAQPKYWTVGAVPGPDQYQSSNPIYRGLDWLRAGSVLDAVLPDALQHQLIVHPGRTAVIGGVVVSLATAGVLVGAGGLEVGGAGVGVAAASTSPGAAAVVSTAAGGTAAIASELGPELSDRVEQAAPQASRLSGLTSRLGDWLGRLSQVPQRLADWWSRGSDADAAWSRLSWREKFFYELGQKTLSSDAFGGVSDMDPVSRGRFFWDVQGLRSVFSNYPQLGNTWGTGPTPLIRWFTPRFVIGGAFGGAVYWATSGDE